MTRQRPAADCAGGATPDPSASAGRVVWHLATNQLNLMYLLAAGLITGPHGFGQKYFQDPLAALPGLIPLFAERLPGAALAEAVAEGPHLRRVIAALDLSALRGPVLAMMPDGEVQERRFPDGLTGEEALLLVPAPLPAHWISMLLFASAADRSATQEEASAYANVPLAACKQQVKPRLFDGDALLPWPPALSGAPPADPSPRQVSAVGAALALFTALGNAGAVTEAAARALWALPQGQPDDSDEPMLRALLRWVLALPEAEADGAQGRLLQRLLTALVEAADGTDACPPDPRQVVLDNLAEGATRLADVKWRDALNRLGEDLRGCVALGDATVTELLQRHPRPFSRGLLLFFLRERCEDLIAFRHPTLNDPDVMVAAALFAARWGWMAIPAAQREVTGLAAAVQQRMAALAQQQQGTGLDLGPAPAPVLPLRALLTAATPKAAKDAGLRLARELGWAGDLVTTRISLGKGEYRLSVDGGGAHLLLAGDVKAVVNEVDQAALLARLAETEVPARLEAQLREMLTPRGKMTGLAASAHDRPSA